MINHVTVVGLDAPINLLYGNRSPSEIAYRREVDRRSTPVEVIHTLTQPDRGWSGRTGRIDISSFAAQSTGTSCRCST
jgi:ferredoxin-NADP reductase